MLKQLLPHLWTLVLFAVHMLVCARALTRPNRIPSSRVAWVAVIMLLPVVGVVAYFLLGETNIGRGRVERLQKTEARLRLPTWPPVAVPDHAAALFDLGHSITGLAAVGGNRIRLLGDPAAPLNEPMRNAKAAMDTLIADIGQARSTVHIAFYIWLDDDTGQRMAQAVEAAARRGVAEGRSAGRPRHRGLPPVRRRLAADRHGRTAGAAGPCRAVAGRRKTCGADRRRQRA